MNWEGMDTQKGSEARFTYGLGHDGQGQGRVSRFGGMERPEVFEDESGGSFPCFLKASAKKMSSSSKAYCGRW